VDPSRSRSPDRPRTSAAQTLERQPPGCTSRVRDRRTCPDHRHRDRGPNAHRAGSARRNARRPRRPAQSQPPPSPAPDDGDARTSQSVAATESAPARDTPPSKNGGSPSLSRTCGRRLGSSTQALKPAQMATRGYLADRRGSARPLPPLDRPPKPNAPSTLEGAADRRRSASPRSAQPFPAVGDVLTAGTHQRKGAPNDPA
jgi:hypothetical protein